MRVRSHGPCGLLLAALLIGMPVHAQNPPPAPATIGGMSAQPELSLPSPVRVLAAIAVSIGLAFGAIVLLKRLSPGVAARQTPAGTIRVLARTNLTSSLHVHVVEVDATRVLIVEGRGAISTTLLPKRERGDEAAGS